MRRANCLNCACSRLRTLQKPGANNYGLNTVLQTNLVDSRGRVMKGVSVVPIKVPTSSEMKSGRTRYLL
uniref:Transposase n=1 Tax=Ascaris lumbricoides TaxID=6252 RepID=A0A0M3HJW7_ASCLU